VLLQIGRQSDDLAVVDLQFPEPAPAEQIAGLGGE
jgi:hypothetical protein